MLWGTEAAVFGNENDPSDLIRCALLAVTTERNLLLFFTF